VRRRREGTVRVEGYGLIGDAALVGRNGSVDWLCLPRFDSPSCFSALLGNEAHGCWLVAPAGEVRSCSRRYRPGTLVLDTDFETDDGTVRVLKALLQTGYTAEALAFRDYLLRVGTGDAAVAIAKAGSKAAP
jgi:GH15 family glucan-1,4-alpha-glucosidase